MSEKTTYTGWRKWYPTSDEWVEFYAEGKVPFEMKENEYLMVFTDDNTVSHYCYEKGKFRKFTGGSIKTFKERNVEETEKSDKKDKERKDKKSSKGRSQVLTPRNVEQICAFDLMKDPTKTIKLLTGTWGTGKTMLLVGAALEALQQGQFERIIWIRNNTDLKGTKDLGALPGEVIDKLLPFLGPFIDHAGEHSVRTMLDRGTLVVEPLQSLRGRNFKNSIIMCSEAENLTKEHIQLIIARCAEGSAIYLDGDQKQVDNDMFIRSPGMRAMIDCLQGNELFGYVHLIKSERSPTASLADKLDNFDPNNFKNN